MPHIKPTIGRVVYFRGTDCRIRAAMITDVHSDDCVNLRIHGNNPSDIEDGHRTSITYADPEQQPAAQQTWHWMPYQMGQAAKSEQLEKQLADKK